MIRVMGPESYSEVMVASLHPESFAFYKSHPRLKLLVLQEHSALASGAPGGARPDG